MSQQYISLMNRTRKLNRTEQNIKTTENRIAKSKEECGRRILKNKMTESVKLQMNELGRLAEELTAIYSRWKRTY